MRGFGRGARRKDDMRGQPCTACNKGADQVFFWWQPSWFFFCCHASTAETRGPEHKGWQSIDVPGALCGNPAGTACAGETRSDVAPKSKRSATALVLARAVSLVVKRASSVIMELRACTIAFLQFSWAQTTSAQCPLHLLCASPRLRTAGRSRFRSSRPNNRPVFSRNFFPNSRPCPVPRRAPGPRRVVPVMAPPRHMLGVLQSSASGDVDFCSLAEPPSWRMQLASRRHTLMRLVAIITRGKRWHRANVGMGRGSSAIFFSAIRTPNCGSRQSPQCSQHHPSPRRLRRCDGAFQQPLH